MVTPQQSQILVTYAALMTEAKARLGWIKVVTEGHIKLEGAVAREFCFLQVRLVCELVVLGCLVAHGEITETQEPRVQKQWSPTAIMKELERLHPDFYPHPHNLVPTGPRSWHFDFVEEAYVTKDELGALYGRANDVLHRGALKNVLPLGPLCADLDEVIVIHRSLVRLLDVHRIAMLKPGTQFVCLRDGAEGNVNTFIAKTEADAG